MWYKARDSQPDWAGQFATQVRVYSFLSKTFSGKPDISSVTDPAAAQLCTDWPLAPWRENIQSGLRLLSRFRAGWHPADLPTLCWDYECLFVGPSLVLAPPWESVYLNLGAALPPSIHETILAQAIEPATDHIGHELAVIAHLCSAGLSAVEQNQQATLSHIVQVQKEFLAKHLLRWTPDCLWRVVQQACTDYYRGVAYLALGCLEEAAHHHDLEAHLTESSYTLN